MTKETKHEKPLKLDIPFEEALKRIVSVSKKEIKEAIGREKKDKESKLISSPLLKFHMTTLGSFFIWRY